MFLPNLRIELVRSQMSDPNVPLALVIAREGGAVKDERSLLGNTRLDEVSLEARALGVRPRQTIAAARAKCSSLRVRVVPLGAVREALARIAESLLAFGATTSFDLDGNGVWVDVTGCAHLHRSPVDPNGEPTLAERIGQRVGELAHVCRVAIADGPLVAAAVAPIKISLDAMPQMPDLPADDQYLVDHFFVPGLERQGGMAAARRLALGDR